MLKCLNDKMNKLKNRESFFKSITSFVLRVKTLILSFTHCLYFKY